MPRLVLPRAICVAPLIAALTFTALPASAQDQGTAEQREACAPDAINLCQDTIPDVPKTTACMQRHLAELSPKCRAQFEAATGGPDSGPGPAAVLPPPAPPAAEEEAHDDGLDGYRASIRRSCRRGLIDPFTCRNTMDALGMAH